MTSARRANATGRLWCGPGPDDRTRMRDAARMKAMERLPQYLAACSRGLDRRIRLPATCSRLASVALQTPPTPDRVLEPTKNDA